MARFAHYGILGMKWGVRRTPEQLGHKTKVKDLEPKDIARGKRISDETKKFIESAKQVDRSIGKFYKKPVDLSKMSDDDLRKYVQRMNLERQYRQLSSEDVSRGKASVGDILEIAGASVGIVSSSLAIAIAIKQLQKE